MAYLSTGRRLRAELEAETEMGLRVEPYLRRGDYVPDDLVWQLVLGWLTGLDQSTGWILDGFPRTLPQALALDKYLHPREEDLRAIVLTVARDELEQRAQDRRECTACSWSGTSSQASGAGTCPVCGGTLTRRDDDAIENFRNRLEEFESLTAPLADYYEDSRRLHRVSGAGSPDDVYQRILSVCDIPEIDG